MGVGGIWIGMLGLRIRLALRLGGGMPDRCTDRFLKKVIWIWT